MAVFPQTTGSVRSVRRSMAGHGVLHTLAGFLTRLTKPRAHDDLLRAGAPQPATPSYVTTSFGVRPTH